MTGRIVYVPGIGADHRAFSRLKTAPDQPQVYADWLSLESTDESFETYCKRLVDHYKITNEDTLIGLSFGGLVVQQIAKVHGNKQVILVSSFRNRSDLKVLWTYCLKFKLYRLVPAFQLPLLAEVASPFLHSWRRKESKILREMLKDANFKLIRWSLKQIALIDLKSTYHRRYLSLIGDKDLLIRTWCSDEMIIPDGAHFMIYTKAEAISGKINAYLQE